MQAALLILDLDETLIHARRDALAHPPDFHCFHYPVYKRPGLDAFLRTCAAHYRLAVWSSASDDYVEKIVAEIFPEDIPLEFVWGRSRCTPRALPYDSEEYWENRYSFAHYRYAKMMHKVRRRGYDISRILIVDDTPSKVENCYGNAIYPTEFEGDPEDRELKKLAAYLVLVKDEPDFRRLEKRNWRDKV